MRSTNGRITNSSLSQKSANLRGNHKMKIEIIALNSEDAAPPEGGVWILIEEDSSGNWYGTGFGTNADGGEVIYIGFCG